MDTNQHTQSKRDGEGQHTEHQRPAPVLPQVLQVHFQTGKEHDVINSHLSEQFEAAVTFQNVESVLTDYHSSQNHTNDMGNPQPSQQNGGKENDHQHKEKYPCRISYREMYADIHAFKSKVPSNYRQI